MKLQKELLEEVQNLTIQLRSIKNSSDVWSSFRVASRASTFEN